MDELYALWAGGRSPNCGTLSSWARTLGNEMDTVFVGQSIVNEAMVNLLTEMLHAARTGESALAGYVRTAGASAGGLPAQSARPASRTVPGPPHTAGSVELWLGCQDGKQGVRGQDCMMYKGLLSAYSAP